MIIFSHYFFILLKERVLAKAQVKQLIPSECQRLSLLILASTKKKVSETTLKRIYGFAVSKFKPSPFTMQTLSEYCGYDSWEDFCGHDEQQAEKSPEKASWQNLYKRTNRITQITLQSLKKRSGIPFNLTLKRKFITEHFDAFLQSNKTVTLFVAQSGYGKTVGLCHLVEDLLEQNLDYSCNQNIILFFSTIANIASNDFNLGTWLLSFLGFQTENNIIELFEEQELRSEKFYLIIDGFDEYMFKPDQYLVFFNQLIDLISYYSKYSWFKIVLTMRSATWLNYRYLVEEKMSLHEKWYSGFMQDENKIVNSLPFSIDEITTLSQKINHAIKFNTLLPVDVIKQLNNPLFFQLYYQNNTQNFSLENFDLLSFYQMISTYAVNRIYCGSNSMEKIILIKTFLEKINYQSPKFSLKKIDFYAQIKTYPNTYKELVSIDIFREENFSKYLQYDEQISFGNITLLEYALARKLYGWNNEKLDLKLISEIEILLEKSTIKVPVLKWMLFFIINNNSFDQLNNLKDISLQASERLELIVFTCQLLQKKLGETKDQEILKTYFQQIEQNETFSFFLSLQYITPNYEKALFTLLNFDLNNRNKILVYTTLSATSILNMNADKAEKYIKEISKFPIYDLEEFIVNPLHCLDTIVNYFKYGVLQKDALQEITHLIYNDIRLRKMSTKEFKINEIILKLALLTLRLNNNPHKEIRFINTVKKCLKSIEPNYITTVYTFYLGLSASAYLKIGKSRKAIETQIEMLNIQNSENSMFTPFMKILFNMIAVKNSSENYGDRVALLQTKSLMAYSSKNGFKLAEVFLGILYLTSPRVYEKTWEDLIEIYSNTLKQIRSSGFRLESFINPQLQLKIENSIANKSKVA